MVERSGEHNSTSSTTHGSERQRQSGCPVQHSTTDDASVTRTGAGSSKLSRTVDSAAVADGAVAPAAVGRGLWSSIASWIPFHGGTADKDKGSQLQHREGLHEGGRVSSASSEGGDTTEGCPVVPRTTVVGAVAGEEAASPGCPVQDGSSAAGGRGGGRADGEDYNALNNEYVYGQEVSPDQAIPLSVLRQRSSIPKAEFNPSHQPKASDVARLRASAACHFCTTVGAVAQFPQSAVQCSSS